MQTRPTPIHVSRAALALVAFVSCCLPAAGRAEETGPLKVFYFGNSFLENSVPWFHPTLFKTAGVDLTMQSQIGPGWQIWMHVNTFYEKPDGAKKTLAEGDWNGVIIQHFGAHPMLKDNVRTTVFDGQKPFPEPRDVSDSASAAAIIDVFLSRHPDTGRVFIYNSWPGMPGMDEFNKRVREESEKSYAAQGLPREEVLKKVKERKATLEELTPIMRASDYATEWLAKYEPDPKKSFGSKHTHSRDYVWALMDELKKKYPKLAAENRLALIPNGDVFLALDEKMRAGKVPGIENVFFFSRDGGHVRGGLPRYTLAATCFAVMTGRHPKALDYSVYNDIENYKNEVMNKMPGKIGPGYIHMPDVGELLTITPELAAVVNDTIWEVVTTHPHTGLAPRN